jgi:TolB-like protein
MVRAFVASLVIAFLVISCSSSKKVASGPKYTIAVLDFESRAGVKPEEAQTMRDAFATQLQQTGRFTVVDRGQTEKVLTEQQFQAMQTGTGDMSTMGKMLAVRKFVAGSVGKLGEDYIFNIKMTDVETAGIDFAISKRFNGDIEDVVEDLFPEMIQELLRTVDQRK